MFFWHFFNGKSGGKKYTRDIETNYYGFDTPSMFFFFKTTVSEVTPGPSNFGQKIYFHL